MSSRTQARRDRRAVRAGTLVLVVLAVLGLGATGAAAVPTSSAAVPLPDVAVLPKADPHVSMVINVGGGTEPVRQESVSVVVGGARQPATVESIMSDRLAVGIVVDASEAGRDQLQAWLSGAARFVLEAPAAAHAAVIADTTPPRVLATLQQGPVDLVRAISAVQAHGKRQTSEALTLAIRQLPATPAGPRVVIMYTMAPDAGGEAASQLAARLAKAHVLLVVASTAPDTRYWSTAARATGGFLAPAGPAAVVPALDQIATMLRTRYLVTFPTPDQRPSHAFVRVDLPEVAMAADVVVPGTRGGVDGQPAPGRDRAGAVRTNVALAAAVLGATVLILVAAVLRRRISRRPRS
jgi:von Willebrand factor type A domain